MRKTAGFIQIYAIGGIAIAILSGLLYWAIESKGKVKAELRNEIAVSQAKDDVIARLQRESQLTEVLLVEHAGKRETIIEQKEIVKTRIREVIRDAPTEDCINQPVDIAILDCLLSDDCEAARDTLQTAANADDGR